MKGIVLAAGQGTRLSPLTHAISKPLLPVYDKPMVYYALSTVIGAGIEQILVITPPNDLERFKLSIGDGQELGVTISYAVQPEARGIADALLVGRDFIGGDSVCLALGDNIFIGEQLPAILQQAVASVEEGRGAHILTMAMDRPERFTVLEIDPSSEQVLSLEEKPKQAKSRYGLLGLYLLDNRAVEFAATLPLSPRGELEIADVIEKYRQIGQLRVTVLEEKFGWFDAGTPDSLVAASNFMHDLMIHSSANPGCLEIAAYQAGRITLAQLNERAKRYAKTHYGQLLQRFINSET